MHNHDLIGTNEVHSWCAYFRLIGLIRTASFHLVLPTALAYTPHVLPSFGPAAGHDDGRDGTPKGSYRGRWHDGRHGKARADAGQLVERASIASEHPLPLALVLSLAAVAALMTMSVMTSVKQMHYW